MSSTLQAPPPTVYGELSILGFNGYIPSGDRSGRRDRSKFLLCGRPKSNGIKKSRHYIVKQPQATRAIQDNDLYSISYTFSRSQTIIVEYKPDETTDMFQIGRSSEEPIDFVVMDTLSPNCANLTNQSPAHGGSNHGQHCHHSNKHHHHHHQQQTSPHALPSSSSNNNNNVIDASNYPPPHYPIHHTQMHSENASSSHQQMIRNDLIGMTRFHRHLAKVGEEMLQYGFPPHIHDSRDHRPPVHPNHGQSSAVLLNYPPPTISNLPQMMANHLRYQETPMFFHHQPPAHSSSAQQSQPPFTRAIGSDFPPTNNDQREHSSNRRQQDNNCRLGSGNNLICKRSHTTQSTISRFACRVIVDREPPYTARIYAAGFDSSKNIFLGEKATKWEQNNSIDGLTTNGILLMHPKKGFFQNSEAETRQQQEGSSEEAKVVDMDSSCSGDGMGDLQKNCSDPRNSVGDPYQDQENSALINGELHDDRNRSSDLSRDFNRVNNENNSNNQSDTNLITSFQSLNNRKNNPSNSADCTDQTKTLGTDFECGGVWREVSVDGGIYAIRESRSAIQKGRRIENETNILQDGTLIDLCGATLLWRSLDGFRASPTKKSLEEKIDLLNASRPQCPVGLNTLVIPRRPMLPGNIHRGHNQHHHRKDHSAHKNGLGDEKSGHQPYVYLKCGHVQGYHDWGTTEKSNQRTCPICLSVGTVAKLSIGLEPSFYVDSAPLSHVFNPCGHMATEKTVKYWSSIKIPHGTHFFHAVCPFCATPLATSETPFTKIIFQCDFD